MSNVMQKQIGVLPAFTFLNLNTETLVAYTGRCAAPLPTMRAIIKGWATVTLGAGVAALGLRIRRGNGINGAQLVYGGGSTLPALLTDDFAIVWAESVQNVEYVDYSLTVQHAGASGNGNVSIASIEVELING